MKKTILFAVLTALVLAVSCNGNDDNEIASQVYLKAASTILVRARGTNGTEHIRMTIAGTQVGSWTLTTSFANYTCTTDGTGGINVQFDNDASGRDVQIDYIAVNSITRQAEEQANNTGVYQNSKCGGSNSEWLHCNGYIDFGDVGSDGGTSSYEVATWSGFCTAVVSYTFDDNCSNQVVVAIPALNTYGFKGTFFTVTNWSVNWQSLKSAATNGHEIASHTKSHTSMNTLSATQQTTEITGSISTITSNVGVKAITLAWPNCNVGSTSVAQQYLVAARGCSGQIEPSTPANFMNISSFVCGNVGTVKANADFQSKANSAANSKGWVVYLIHGIDNDGGYSPLSSTELKNSFSFFNSNSSKFWVASFGSVARYIKERNAVTVTQTASDANSVTVKITDNLDNSIYNVPLTIRRPLPSGWVNASVTQNGQPVTSSIVTVNSVGYIMFNAVPDAGDVVLLKK